MKINPIFKRELMVSSRSKSLPALICVVNSLLFAVTLLGAFGVTASMRISAKSDYGAFLRIYGAVTLMEFILLLFITPSLTAGAISSEREKETFDLMLTTQMKPSGIVFGKLMSNLSFIGILAASCIPAVLVSVMYGGVTVFEIIILLLSFVFEAFLFMSAGIFFSSFSKSTARASAFTYGFIVFLCFGTAVISALFSAVSGNRNPSVYLLLFNPLANVINIVAGQMGEQHFFYELLSELKGELPLAAVSLWSVISVICQTGLAALLLFMSVVNISPKRKKRKELDFKA